MVNIISASLGFCHHQVLVSRDIPRHISTFVPVMNIYTQKMIIVIEKVLKWKIETFFMKFEI